MSTARYRPVPEPGSPPAVWLAFVRASRWKSAALGALAVMNLGLLVCLGAAVHTEPDVVLVGPDGASTYLEPQVAGAALMRFLADQRHRPSDLTVAHHAREVLRLLLEVNSTTARARWPRLLAELEPALAKRFVAEDRTGKVLATTEAAGISSSLEVGELAVSEVGSGMFRVEARACRVERSLVHADAPARAERLHVELFERVIPRTPSHPDGLLVADLQVSPAPAVVDGGEGGCHAP